MHADPTTYALTAPPTLTEALTQLARGTHTPIAGGTELMVALNSGRLTQRSLLSINHLDELRFIRAENGELHIGSGTTFTDIRRNALIAETFPLLQSSASWTGSIANQNRATLGGNCANASPAADTPPALLAYNARIQLIGANPAGAITTRWLPYEDFHLGYKRTALAPHELIHTIAIPMPHPAATQWIRKVGTRNAQAISKVAIAAVATVNARRIATIRLAAASLADRPLRLSATEQALTHASLDPADLETTLRLARAALASEAAPIDDIRSTARYRTHVAANLIEQFLRSL